MKEHTRSMADELLDTFEFAHLLNDEQLHNLITHSDIQEVEAGTIIAEKGSYCHGLALLLFGQLRVAVNSIDGREVTIYNISKGRVCPLSAACVLGDFKGNAVTVSAKTDARVIWVMRDFFVRSFAEAEPFYRFVIGDISNRLFEATEVLDNIAFVSVKKRLAQLLVTNSRAGKAPIYITHEEIARELGTAREVVSRELKGFERLGLLALSRGRIDLIDSGKLEEICHNGVD